MGISVPARARACQSAGVLELPAALRNKAMVAGADAWLEQLPALVADLERDWEITVGRILDGGTEALVAEATTPDGTPAVLKVLVPRSEDAARHEITVLELAAGQGCPRLFRSDVDRGALLMERLGPSMYELGLPLHRRHALLCDAVHRLWRPAPGVDRVAVHRDRPAARRRRDAGRGCSLHRARLIAEDVADGHRRTGSPVRVDGGARSSNRGAPASRGTRTPRAT